MRQDCASALCNMTACVGYESSIIKEGVVKALTVLGLVRSSDDTITRKCVFKALYNLLSAATNEGSAKTMVEEGVVWGLAHLANLDHETKKLCASALSNLALYQGGRANIAQKDCLRIILELSRERSAEIRQSCARCLYNLTCLSEGKHAPVLAKEQGVRTLTMLSNIDDAKTKEMCAAVLCTIACTDSVAMQVLTEGGLNCLTTFAGLGPNALGTTHSWNIKRYVRISICFDLYYIFRILSISLLFSFQAVRHSSNL